MNIKILSLGLSVLALLFFTGISHAGWEIGAKAGYDSNVDRAVDNGRGDTIFTGYALYFHDAAPSSQIDWTLTVAVEGNAYAKISDLNYGMGTIAPGITYAFSPVWSVNLSPFVQAKGVSDSDQSAWAFGGKVNLRQQWRNDFYTGQYYTYTDSRASVDTYSYTENAVGVIIGANWTTSFMTEATYEFSQGDTFCVINTTTTTATTTAILNGKGYRRYNSSAFNETSVFNETVVQDKVNRHVIGFNANYNFTKSLFVALGYTFAVASGDLGTSTLHYGWGGLGYRF